MDNLQHRKAQVTLTINHDGVPLANHEVVVEQTRHQFLFGANWGSVVALANGELSGAAKERAEQRNEHFLALFNQATLPFYWGRFEPERGKPDTQRILAAARWYRDRGCVTKGHPLCWHTVTAPWLLELSDDEILQAQISRIKREVADFAGVIDLWDVVNEAVIMPIFDRYDNGITRIARQLERIELIRTMFDAARSANPNVTLLLNDFDMSPAYDILIEGCLKAGIKIDVIGLQSHMHQGYWGVEKTLRILERFARFGLPIHFTETTIVSGHVMPPEIVDLNDYQVGEWPSTSEGEARQAEEVVRHYETLFAHPAVEAITWWDFSDGGWLNAPAGLLRKDESPKPAYDELLKRVKGAWWLKPTRLTTDANGQVTFTGFLGDYQVSLDDQKAAFALKTAGGGASAVSV
ncbi:MAG TPA: endo-1,4-beta-xylanase [Phototrophicaceae bacterium]|nr:endo-1,4-beta-xylanase [Phototrophicaceae bacterium]